MNLSISPAFQICCGLESMGLENKIQQFDSWFFLARRAHLTTLGGDIALWAKSHSGDCFREVLEFGVVTFRKHKEGDDVSRVKADIPSGSGSTFLGPVVGHSGIRQFASSFSPLRHTCEPLPSSEFLQAFGIAKECDGDPNVLGLDWSMRVVCGHKGRVISDTCLKISKKDPTLIIKAVAMLAEASGFQERSHITLSVKMTD